MENGMNSEFTDEQLRYLVEKTPGNKAIYQIIGDRIAALYLSPSLHSLVGMEEDEFRRAMERNTADTVLPDDLPDLMNAIRECIRTGKQMDHYWRVFQPEQGFLWVHGSACFCGLRGGFPVLFVSYGTDLNEVDLYKDVVDNSATMAYVCDCRSYEILYANKAAREYAGHTGESILPGKKCYAMIQGRDAPCENCFMKTVARGEILSQDRFNTARGTWEHLSGKYLNWCGRDAFIQYITDITESVKGQNELKELLQLHQLQLKATQILNEEGDTDERINSSLRIMLDYFQADRTYIFMIDEGGKTLSNTYECCREGIEPQIRQLQHGDIHYIDRWLEAFSRYEVFVQKNIGDIRDSDPYEYSIMAPQGINSYIEAPITVGGRLIGFIGADNPPLEKTAYSPDLLLSFAYSLGSAIARAQSEQKIRKYSEELEAVIQNIPIGISMLRVKDGKPIAKLSNPLLGDLYGVAPGEMASADQLAMERIPQPYRARVTEKLGELLAAGTSIHIDFPYHRDDSEERRWYRMDSRSVASGTELLYFSCLSDITDEINAEMEREKVRKMYEAAVETQNIVVWEYDVKRHRIVMANNTFTGYSHRKLGLPRVIENVPESLLPYLDEHSIPGFLAMYDEIGRGAEKASCEVWYKASPGQEARCEHVTYTMVYDENGRTASALGIGMNVTARRQEEEKYNLFYKQMMESNPDTLGSFRLNLTRDWCGDGQSVQPQYLALQESGTMSGFVRSLSEMIVPGEARDSFIRTFCRENLMQEYQRGNTQLSAELPFMPSDRNISWGLGSVSMVKNPLTGDVEAISFMRDITQKKKRDAIDQRLTNEIIDYIGLIDVRKRTFEFSNVNKTIENLPVGIRMGYDACIDYDVRTYVTEEDETLFRDKTAIAHILAELNKAADYAFAYDHRENGGVLRKQLHYAFLDESKREILVIQSDITSAYRQEQEQMLRLTAALDSAEKANAAKTDFLSRMSHDIRTPLNGIIGMTYLAREENDPARIGECLEKIDTSSKFLLGLINDILDMSKAESGKIELHLEPYPPQEFSAYMEAVIRPLVTEKNQTIEYRIDIPEHIVPLQDKLRINQIVFNILSNAVKFTPEGGKIQYRATGELLPGGSMQMHIEVSDNGVGMSEEFQKAIFDPFSQEGRNDNSARRGTGLGMAITKRLVDLMGGTIRVKSTSGQGSTFFVDLPTETVAFDTVKDARPAAGSEKARDNFVLAGKHVLLCEDHPLNQEIARILLAQKGMIVDTAEDGQRGLKQFRQAVFGYYDAVLMDIRMPVMDGYEATRAIRQLDRPDADTVPIIAMTADAFADDVQKCRDAGMNGHIAKPIDPQMLYDELAREIENAQEAAKNEK